MCLDILNGSVLIASRDCPGTPPHKFEPSSAAVSFSSRVLYLICKNEPLSTNLIADFVICVLIIALEHVDPRACRGESLVPYTYNSYDTSPQRACKASEAS